MEQFKIQNKDFTKENEVMKKENKNKKIILEKSDIKNSDKTMCW